MDMPLEEQKRFNRVTCLISASIDEVSGQGYLALDVIEQVLNLLLSFFIIFNFLYRNSFIYNVCY